jgi:hypothetical protein
MPWYERIALLLWGFLSREGRAVMKTGRRRRDG